MQEGEKKTKGHKKTGQDSGKYIKPKYRGRETRSSEIQSRDSIPKSGRFQNLDWFEMTVGQVAHFCRVGYDKQKAIRAEIGLDLQKKNSSRVGEYSQFTYSVDQMRLMAEALNMFLVRDTETDRVFVCRAVREYR